MRYLIASDYAEVSHIVSTTVDKVGICGRQVGPVEYSGEAHAIQLVRLLIELPRGCRKCADMLMTSKHIKAGERPKKEIRT